MKNLLSSGLAKKVLIFAFILGLVSPSALAYTSGDTPLFIKPSLVAINPNIVKNVSLTAEVAPQVNALSVASVTGTAVVSFNLNTPSKTTVWIKDPSDTIVKTLLFNTDLQANQTYDYSWNGTNNSNVAVPSGNYKAQVVAYNTADTAVANYNFSFTSGSVNPPVNNAPVLSNVYASPNPFDPNTTNTRVYFTVDKAATGTVTILNGSTIIRTLASAVSLNAGTYYYEWNGRDNNSNIVSNGTYTANVNVSNSAGTDNQTASVQVSTSGSTSCNNVISSHYANPSTFNPNDDDTQIVYNLSRSANVTVRIFKGSSVIKTLINSSSQSSGQNSTYWNGRYDGGSYVSNGSYTYEIRANASGCAEDIETGYIYISGSTSNDGYVDDWASTNEELVTNLRAVPEIFDPSDGERSDITFYLRSSARLRVEILNGNTVVKTLRNSGSDKQTSGYLSYTWDGRNNNGSRVNDAVYQVRVMADDGYDTDTDRVYLEVDTDGIIIGFPDNARCAGFRDVSTNSPFCKAIELMSKKNIFDGYSDGTFRPYQRINRAETAKVVVLALNYDVPTSGYFGRQYTDTSANAWYSPYLEVAKRNNIATGYPDGSFRPSNTINRVELLRIFLEANDVGMRTCSPAPFEDTPITADTNWYMKYACYAKDNGLMNSDTANKLYPAEAMTRGDVADLFYDFEVKGLYNGYTYDGYNNQGYNYNNNNNYCDPRYDYNCDSYSSNPSNQTCVERDYYGHCTRWEYDNNYSYNNNDGYYVYRNGEYVWVNY